jgi:ligand-binding SRPBCC domain-containing protein
MAERLPARVQLSVVLPAEPVAVWDRAATLTGANAEMAPWLHLAGPPGLGRLDDVAVGEPVDGRLRAFGRLPLGAYPLTLVEVDRAGGFVEQTRSGPFAVWQHERRVRAAPDGGTQVTDQLGWRLRGGLPGAALLTPFVRAFFAHRHRRLVRHWATATAAAG